MVYFFFITRSEGPITNSRVGLHVFSVVTNPGECAFGNVASVRTENYEVRLVTFDEIVFCRKHVKNVSHAASKAESVRGLNFDTLRLYPLASLLPSADAPDFPL